MEYRDKVRALEQLNQQLEEQIRLCLDRKASSAGAWGPLRREWEDIYRKVRMGWQKQNRGREGNTGMKEKTTSGYRGEVSEAILDNARLMLQTENVQANAEDFKERYENEQPFRRAVEEEISSLHRVIEEANMTKVELEEQMESMRAELRSLEHNHEQ
ncbi:hypothetical protein XENORESO_019851, partial [Xenotaenia resolanae]